MLSAMVGRLCPSRLREPRCFTDAQDVRHFGSRRGSALLESRAGKKSRTIRSSVFLHEYPAQGPADLLADVFDINALLFLVHPDVVEPFHQGALFG